MKMETIGEMPYTRQEAVDLVAEVADAFVMSTRLKAKVEMSGNAANIQLCSKVGAQFRIAVEFRPSSNDGGTAYIKMHEEEAKRLRDQGLIPSAPYRLRSICDLT